MKELLIMSAIEYGWGLWS